MILIFVQIVRIRHEGRFKKVAKIYDPVAALPRKHFMLDQQPSLEARIRPAALRRRKGHVVLKNAMTLSKAPRKPAKQADNAETDWAEMVARITQHQDRAAFSAIFTHFAPRIKGFLINSGADATMAEECAQDVMTTLWRKAHQFDPTRASVATWIFTIARNRRIDMLRRQNRPEPEELPWGPEPEPDQADVIAMQQDSATLTRALASLPEAQRDLIEKAYFGDLSQAEIASLTGLPLGTIKSRIRLALDRLRHLMK